MTTPAPNTESSNDWICTQMRGDRIEYEWRIKKFNLLPQKNGESIDSPVFPSNNNLEQWKLRIYPQGQKESDSGWISAFLRPASDKMLGIKTKNEISIFQLENALGTVENTHKFEKMEGWGNPQLVEKSKLSVTNDPSDTITVYCKIKVLGTYITSSSHKAAPAKAVSFETRMNRLSDDFHSLYADPELTDFTVISGDRAFKTHQIILATRCPVLAAMFDHGEMEENINNELKLENIGPAVVEGLLEFIYTDDVSGIGGLAPELLAAAEQYALEGLKNLCEETLYKTLDQNNATELLALADLHNAEQLKKYVMEYIVDNRINVVESEAFDSAEMSLSLAKEMIRALTLPKNKNNESA